MPSLHALTAFLRTRTGLALGALVVVTLVVAVGGGAALVISHAEAAYASVPRAQTGASPALRTALIVPPAISPLPEVVALQDLTPQEALATNQAIPFSTLPNPAAKPFNMSEAAEEDRTRAETCLAQAVYYEAGFEPLAGEQAVAQVVLNRLRHPVYPKTVCGVVFQGAELKTGCQFTFTCDGALGRTPEPVAWARAQGVADAALNGFVMKAVGEATHYHTQYVAPYWSPSLIKLTQIGQHIFYRWTGAFGQPPAFGGQYAGNEPGAATEVASIPVLVPLQKLAVDFGAPVSPASAPTASNGGAAKTPAAGQTAGADTPDTPVQLARAEIAPVQAAAPEVTTVKKVFLPAESLLPRPKWKAF